MGLNFYCKDTKNISDIQNFRQYFCQNSEKNHVVFMTVWVETTAPARTKIVHEKCSGKWENLLCFLRLLVVKISKNAYLQTITKISYFKIC